MTHPTSGGAVMTDKNDCANCVETSRSQQWRPIYRVLFGGGESGHAERWLDGAAPHKSG